MINSRNINDLHPTLQRAAHEFLRRCAAAGLNVGISQTLRCHEYQNHLYAQGRTRPGNIVTNVKGGSSMHNYGLAFDIFKNVKGQEFSDTAFFKACGKIWEDMGGTWGGSWTSFVDMPHMEFISGVTMKDLQAGKKMPDVRMKWESGSPVSPAPSVSPGSSAIQATVMRGSSGEAVKQLQRLLNAKGFSAGVVDGIFGAGTDAAVKGFQKAKNLVSDGVAGPKTWGALLS